MQIITKEWLVSGPNLPCQDQLDIFNARWPHGVAVTVENALVALKLGLNLDWVISCLLPAPYRARYLKDTDPIFEQYLKDTAPYRKRYEEDTDACWERYHKDIAPFKEQYDQDIAPYRERYLKDIAACWVRIILSYFSQNDQSNKP